MKNTLHKLSTLLLTISLALVLIVVTSFKSEEKKSNESPLEIEHIVQGYIGPNHLANLVYRKSMNGDRFVGWGRTPMTEWPVGSASKKQVLPSYPDTRYSNGGCAMDIDGDGDDEIVTASGSMANLSNATLKWYKEVEGEKYWREYEIASIWPNGYTAPHDIVSYEKNFDGEEFKAVIANKARNEVHLFVVPKNPETDKWQHFEIGIFPVNNQSGIELADINNDGNTDLVSGNYWIEAPEDPTQVPWKFHRFCDWDEEGKYRWGGMNKHAVADFDNDGNLDIVAAEAEIPNARLSLFTRQTDDGTGLWKEIPIDKELKVPHSLVAADFDKNGTTDFIVGEMTAGGWNFPLNPRPGIYYYSNNGQQEFEKFTIYEGWGVHEMRLFPQLIQNKVLIYAADEIQPQKFTNMNTHVSYWLIAPAKKE